MRMTHPTDEALLRHAVKIAKPRRSREEKVA